MKEVTMNHEARLFHLKVLDGTLHARLGVGSITNEMAVDMARSSMEFAAGCGADDEVTHAMGFQLPRSTDLESDEDDEDEDEDE